MTCHQNTTPQLLVHDSCTACIVGVARATSATISESNVAHPFDSAWGPPDAHVIVKYHTPKSKEAKLHFVKQAVERDLDLEAPTHKPTKKLKPSRHKK